MSDVDLDSFAQSTVAQEAGHPVEIRNPTDPDTVLLTIVMAGPDSERFRAVRRAVIRNRVNAMDLDLGNDSQQLSDNREIAAGAVISWSPNPKIAGEVLEASPENALKLFKAIPFIFDQCFGVAIDRAVFTKR